ncbi:MAG: protein phosphatase 2C domain-containing protein [Gammaproteobacteria bacterium]|nr:protein phosphatase 2C domain-containing protein [Gammaproteobacteria bacterium]
MVVSSQKLEVAMRQFQGNRERQEDTVAFRRLTNREGAQTVLMVLADGVGGEAGGHVASRLAVNVFCDVMSEPAFGHADDALLDALQLSNQALCHAMLADPSLDNMGCTLLALQAGHGHVRWISVGDSILYRVRGGCIERLNQDHSVAGLKALEHPLLESLPEAVRNRGNALVSAVAGFELPLIDYSDPIRIEEDDILLAASDGIATLEAWAILELCDVGQTAVDIARSLIRTIQERDVRKQDNVSVSVIKPSLRGRRPAAD